MKIQLDTNVILDTLLEREPYNKHSDQIFKLAATDDIVGHFNASSITDIYFIARKKLTDAESRKKIRIIMNLFEVIEVTEGDCLKALDSIMPDFEDALVTVCADKVNIDYIITRDNEFLKLPKAISPDKFLKKFNP